MHSLRKQLEEINSDGNLQLPDLEDFEDSFAANQRRETYTSDNVGDVQKSRLFFDIEERKEFYEAGRRISAQHLLPHSSISGISSGHRRKRKHYVVSDSEKNVLSGENGDTIPVAMGTSDDTSQENTSDDSNVDDGDDNDKFSYIDCSDVGSEDDDADDKDNVEERDDADVSDTDVEDDGKIETLRNSADDCELLRSKAESVRQQISIFDRLMLMQIKVHAGLRVYNQLPRGSLASELLQEADHETKEKYFKVRDNAAKLLDSLLFLEECMLKSSGKTLKLINGQEDAKGEGSCEKKFTSSDDECKDSGISEHQISDSLSMQKQPNISSVTYSSKKLIHKGRLNYDRQNVSKNLGEVLEEREKRFHDFRNEVLSKWDERSRLAAVIVNNSKDFSKFESVALKQIEKIMSDKHRLIRRTQTKRSEFERIGGVLNAKYDVEIFDDDDFYQQVLKDIIDRKSSQLNEPIEMSRQWLEIHRLRQKRSKKKGVDTKASKGRKTRYLVIPQLVNYYPSTQGALGWSHNMRDQLTKSLFK